MRPVSASRARNLMTYLPGSSVKPVSYWIGCVASCAAVCVGQRDVELVAHVLTA